MSKEVTSQLKYLLTNCAPPTELMKLVLTLPRALRDVERLVADPESQKRPASR